ncbi:hypothetical protein [Corynebacterium epidermidicanis]|uniref:Uncharacterized protein n=1 Tax=Corynebacterium epidermidicanis TaxID=1050174 RepID=A0A0G3GY71_9CORY|nr:hypothetical protein [Corynebacterium epidermidicanis]AKK03777.1 hypothetical protein CEPID_09660 [Corynebacterium epidermidicanis]
MAKFGVAKTLLVVGAVVLVLLVILVVFFAREVDERLSPPHLSGDQRRTFEQVEPSLLAELPPNSSVKADPAHDREPTIMARLDLGERDIDSAVALINAAERTLAAHAPKDWRTAIERADFTAPGTWYSVQGNSTPELTQQLRYVAYFPAKQGTAVLVFPSSGVANFVVDDQLSCQDILAALGKLPADNVGLTTRVNLRPCHQEQAMYSMYFRPETVEQQAAALQQFVTAGPKTVKHEATSLPDGTLVINETKYSGQKKPNPADSYAQAWPGGTVRMQFNDFSIRMDGSISEH